MKFLHTADWHLGKLFYGTYLTDEQEWILKNQFLPLLDEERPDVILLAGDVYDRSVPPAEAVELFDDMISEICGKRKIPLIAVSGNHDSRERLSFASRLLSGAGLYLCGDLSRLSPIVISDEYGDVYFLPMPYVETADVRHVLDVDVRTREEAMAALAAHLSETVPKDARTICIAHDFIAGGEASDSERPLSVGGADMISGNIFELFSYTALGHLHGPQKAAGAENIRYSGSLLKYSFGEADQKKGVIIGNTDSAGHVETKFVSLTPRHDVRKISGTFDELMMRDDPAPEDFLLAELTDTGPVIDAMARLRKKYPNVAALTTNRILREDSGARVAVGKRIDITDMLDAFSEEFCGRKLTEEEKAFFEEIIKETEEEI